MNWIKSKMADDNNEPETPPDVENALPPSPPPEKKSKNKFGKHSGKYKSEGGGMPVITRFISLT